MPSFERRNWIAPSSIPLCRRAAGIYVNGTMAWKCTYKSRVNCSISNIQWSHKSFLSNIRKALMPILGYIENMLVFYFFLPSLICLRLSADSFVWHRRFSLFWPRPLVKVCNRARTRVWVCVCVCVCVRACVALGTCVRVFMCVCLRAYVCVVMRARAQWIDCRSVTENYSSESTSKIAFEIDMLS